MRLPDPILRLPLKFDAGALAAEIAALPDDAWVPHPNNLPGNEAVLLVTPNGEMTNAIGTPMAPTRHLTACPYMMEVMGAIGAVWGRSRLMRIAPGGAVPPHVDTDFYWRTHLRLHVPIVTTPDVKFTVAGNAVHMAAGECWVFDTFQVHRVDNGGTNKRTHLVLDTVGGEGLHALIEYARAKPLRDEDLHMMKPGAWRGALAFERFPTRTVMTPWELRDHVGLIRDTARPDPALGPVLARLDALVAGWEGAWAQHGSTQGGVPAYDGLIRRIEADLGRLGGARLLLKNGLFVYHQIGELLKNLRASFAHAAPSGPVPAVRVAAR